jgi:hypothetical protein
MGWPTQIGRWAALGKNSQKYQLFGPLFDKNQNIEKSLTFDPSLGRGLATPELEKVLNFFTNNAQSNHPPPPPI